jgi:ketosteroid isomerase-like protein
MSRENVEVLRAAHEAFNAGLDEFLAYYTEDVELVPDATWPEQGPFRGKRAARDWWAEVIAQYEDRFIELEELIPVDADRIIAATKWHVRGRASEITTTFAVSTVHSLRDGLIFRSQFFLDRDQALEAVGLRE